LPAGWRWRREPSACGAAAASGFDDFLHGGRATGQVGAFVARADDPSAVRYNPAGLVNTEGWELQLGADFSNATDEFTVTSSATTFRADHSIQFPPSLYLTWSGGGPWAWGFGIDAPVWYRVDFDPVFFPGRFQSRVADIELWEAHPVVAYDLGGGWSVGGGLRYLFGSFEQGINSSFAFGPDGVPVEIFLDADTGVDGFGWDVGTQFRSVVWGFGATYKSGVEVEGSGDLVRRGARRAPWTWRRTSPTSSAPDRRRAVAEAAPRSSPAASGSPPTRSCASSSTWCGPTGATSGRPSSRAPARCPARRPPPLPAPCRGAAGTTR
jgi:long-subunit fatty acid transport protein